MLSEISLCKTCIDKSICKYYIDSINCLDILMSIDKCDSYNTKSILTETSSTINTNKTYTDYADYNNVTNITDIKTKKVAKRKWTIEEEEMLKELWGKVVPKSIAKRLNRTETSIIIRAKRLNLGPFCQEYLTFNNIADLLGLDPHCISDTWKSKGLKYKKYKNKYLVKVENLLKFMKENQDLWDSRKLEPLIFGKEPKWLKEKRELDKTKPKNKFVKWTPTQDNMLITYLRKYNYEEIGKMLGRSTNSVERRVARLKEKGRLLKNIMVPWTQKEDEYLIEMDKIGVEDKDIAYNLGRDVLHVRDHRRNLKKKGKYPFENKRSLIVDTENKKMLELLKEKDIDEVATILKRHPYTIKRRLKDLGL